MPETQIPVICADLATLPHQEQYDVIMLLRQIADRLEETLSEDLVRQARQRPVVCQPLHLPPR